MADQRNGGIAWTDETWNPLRGCSRASEGCRNCYAENMAARFCGTGQPYEGTINPETKRWNGNVRLVPEKLADPLRWARSRMVFVNSMSDLFHEAVPDEFIDQVFAVMALAPQHTFQSLTKRPARMRDYCNNFSWKRVIESCTGADRASVIHGFTLQALRHHFGVQPESSLRFERRDAFPLPNVWLGVTVENQEAADERIPLLLQTPAAVRWVSMEPLLGPISFEGMFANPGAPRDGTNALEALDWVVVGGESGPSARPMHPDWARSLRDQCNAAGVPFLFKQWGEIAPWEQLVASTTALCASAKEYVFPDGTKVERFGKRLTGRALDGYEYNGYPEARP